MAVTISQQIAAMVGARPKPLIYAARQLTKPSRWHGQEYAPGAWAVYTSQGQIVGVLEELLFRQLFTIDGAVEFAQR